MPESPITLEMLGLVPATRPLKLTDENPEFLYKGYRGIGENAACGLHYYQGDNVRVFIVTELPNNPGTSITNRAEVVAETIEETYDLVGAFEAGDEAGRPKRSGDAVSIYIEHYPRSKRRGDFDENFSIVTFLVADGRDYTDPKWTPLSRTQVELLIGQKFEGYEFE